MLAKRIFDYVIESRDKHSIGAIDVLFWTILPLTLLWIVWRDVAEISISESAGSYAVFTCILLLLLAIRLLKLTFVEKIWLSLRRLNPAMLAINFFLAVLFATVFDAIVVRRVVFASVMAPTAVAVCQHLVPAIRQRANWLERVTLSYIAIIFAAFILPGFYFPPFYDGICGWVSDPARTAPVRLGGFRLVRDDGESVWFSHAIINPVNFMWRQDQHSRDTSGAKLENFELLLAYYFKLYTQRYPVLKTGRMPNQSILGRFAYPGHNPYRMLPYGELPPRANSG